MKSAGQTNLLGQMKAWLESWEFYANPFAIWDAAKEPDLDRYYVKPPFYDQLLTEPVTSLIYSYRGGGKSAALRMIASQCRPHFRSSRVLAVPFTDFSPFAEDFPNIKTNTLRDYLKKIIELSLMAAIRDIWKRSRQGVPLDDNLLSECHYWISTYAKHLLIARSTSSLHKMLFSAPLQNMYPDPPRWEQYLSQAPYFEPFWKTLLDTVPIVHYPQLESPSQIMQAFVRFILHLLSIGDYPCQALFLLVDGVDEYLVTQDNADAAAEMLKPLLGSLRFLETPGLAVKFFLPVEFRSSFDSLVRTDRLPSYELLWKSDGEAQERSRELLRSRIRFFNKAGIQSLAEICAPGLRSWIEDAILEETQGLPRDILRLGNQIFVEHCRETPEPETEILPEDWERALAWYRGNVLPKRSVSPPAEPRESTSEDEKAGLVLTVDLKTGKVTLGRKEIPPLPELEYRLLAYLYRRKGEICSRDEIIQAVYPGIEGISDDVLGSLVYRLRNRLGENVQGRKISKNYFIRTIPRRGYRLDNTL